jgi:hypothetical protein
MAPQSLRRDRYAQALRRKAAPKRLRCGRHALPGVPFSSVSVFERTVDCSRAPMRGQIRTGATAQQCASGGKMLAEITHQLGDAFRRECSLVDRTE